jgi:hypothetical protein
MERAGPTTKAIVLMLGLVASMGCGISGASLRATAEAEVRPSVATEAWQAVEAEIETAVAATQTVMAATQTVALMSFHGRYVTALGGGSSWLLTQEPSLGDCGWFTLHYRDNGKVALTTCYGRYVTASNAGATRADWMLWQESQLGDCGQFILHELSDGIALETCGERFLTAGDGGWEPPWSVVAETHDMLSWEQFTVLRR